METLLTKIRSPSPAEGRISQKYEFPCTLWAVVNDLCTAPTFILLRNYGNSRETLGTRLTELFFSSVRPRLLYLSSPSWRSCISRKCQHNIFTILCDAHSLLGLSLVFVMLWNSAALIESVGSSDGLQVLCKRSKFFDNSSNF